MPVEHASNHTATTTSSRKDRKSKAKSRTNNNKHRYAEKPHCAAERKYRTNLKRSFEALDKLLTEISSKNDHVDFAVDESQLSAKGRTLSTAVNVIGYLTQRLAEGRRHNAFLAGQLQAADRQFKCDACPTMQRVSEFRQNTVLQPQQHVSSED
ncbi:hypothetical protein MBLNU457_3811t1 [Dothideomycetes sp. NU457]